MKKEYSPYGSFSLNEIKAPKKEKNPPKSTKIKSDSDLRVKRGK